MIVNRNAVYRVLKRKGGSCINGSPPRVLVCRAGSVGPVAVTNGGPWMSRIFPVGKMAGPSRGGDRLSRSRGHRLRVRLTESGEGGRARREAACLARFGTLRPVGRQSCKRNGLIFPESTVSTSLPGLSVDPGVHHTVYAGTEWDHRTVLPQSQEECVWQHVFRTFEDARRVIRDWMQWVQPGAPASGLGLSEPGSISGATTHPGGLISGHYRPVVPWDYASSHLLSAARGLGPARCGSDRGVDDARGG